MDPAQLRLVGGIALRSLRLWQVVLMGEERVTGEKEKSLEAAEQQLGRVLENLDAAEGQPVG